MRYFYTLITILIISFLNIINTNANIDNTNKFSNTIKVKEDITITIKEKLKKEGEIEIEEIKRINDRFLLLTNLISIEHIEEGLKDSDVVKNAVTIIKDFEGFSHYPYWDHKGYSIGYGLPSRGRGYISRGQADIELYNRASGIKKYMEKNYKLKNIDPAMKVALISFFYNVGYRNRVIVLAQKNDKDGLVKEMLLYNRASGKRLSGLVKRRVQETKFLKKYYKVPIFTP